MADALKNYIDGAMTITVTKSGSYNVISGQHRQMPNHEIYITRGTTWAQVYKRDYLSLSCLVAWGCAAAEISGSGSY